jgi:hypothetical protein
VITPACSAASAWGILNVDAGSVRLEHSLPPTTVMTPSSGIITKHSPAPMAMARTTVSMAVQVKRLLDQAQRRFQHFVRSRPDGGDRER